MTHRPLRLRPPRLAEWLLERLVPDGIVGESVVGDARESFEEATKRVGRRRASAAYWSDVVRIGMALRLRRPLRASPPPSWSRLNGLVEDARHVLRSFVRTPGFALVIVATLGLGMGAAAAVFSVLDGVLLRPLPYEDGDRLVQVLHSAPGIAADRLGLSTATFFTFLDDARTLDGVGAWGNDLAAVTGAGEPEEVAAVRVTHELLPLLGVRPARGRLFDAADDTRGSPRVVILSSAYWRTRLGADPAVVGRTLLIDGESVEIIGVLPSGFRFMGVSPLLYFPIRFDRSSAFVGSFNYNGVARVRPEAKLEEVRAELQRLIPVAAESYPGGASVERVTAMELQPIVEPLKETVTGNVGSMLWLLLCATVFLLLVGCANVANLFLVRAESRQREWAIRAILGAGRGRMMRLFVMESAVLSAAAMLLGLALAAIAIRLIIAFGPANVPRLADTRINAAVIAFGASLTLVATLVLSLVPLLRYVGAGGTARVVELGRGQSATRRRQNVRTMLTVIQLALALTLLIGAGLMIRSVRSISAVDPGFGAADAILTFRIYLPEREAATPDAVLALHRRIREAIAAIPGVVQVGQSSSVPMDGRLTGNTTVVEDRRDATAPSRRYKFVSDGFFSTMQVRLLAGRDFTSDDIESRRDVAIVSESFARDYWQDAGQAIGKRIAQNPSAGWREIVGVVADVRDDGPTNAPVPLVWWPIATRDFWGVQDLVQRTLVYAVRVADGDAMRLITPIRRAVWSIDDRLPIASPRTQQAIVDQRTASTSFVMVLLTIAAGLAVVLGLVGVYGAIAWLVSTRTREIGVRLAVGAVPANVVLMILRNGLSIAVAGTALGVFIAVALTRLMVGLLFGVEATDPVTFAAAAATVVTVAALATAIPAMKAASIDPVRALNTD